MTIDEALRYGTTIIGRRDTLLLLSHVTGLSHTDLQIHGERALSSANTEHLMNLIAMREQKKPLQYILGQWAFMGLDFIVDANVLIPRADTEILVEYALEWLRRAKQDRETTTLRVMDLCTGSGCIGVALAHYAGVPVTAVDICSSALRTAKKNAELNGVADKMHFVESDLFNQFQESELFDLIASNPPYIPTGELKNLDDDVRLYEPVKALDGGVDGLDLYRRLIPDCMRYLNPGGVLLLEIGPSAGVVALMRVHGFGNVGVIKDYAGFDRVVFGVR